MITLEERAKIYANEIIKPITIDDHQILIDKDIIKALVENAFRAGWFQRDRTVVLQMARREI